MEPGSAEQLSTSKPQTGKQTDPIILLLSLKSETKSSENENSNSVTVNSATASNNTYVEDEENGSNEKLLEEENKNNETVMTVSNGQKIDQVGLSSDVEIFSNSTIPYPTKSAGRISTHRKITCERLKELKVIVDKAVKENKTFCIHGCCPAVRNALRQRGWIEKRWRESRSTIIIPSVVKRSRKARSTNDMSLARSASRSSCYNVSTYHYEISESSSSKIKDYEGGLIEEEDNIISRMLRNVEPALVWSARADTFEWGMIPKHQTINRFPRTSFTTKVGLCNYLQQMHWFYESGISDTLFPRCYCVCLPEEMQAFRDDFRLTACMSLLKWLVYNYEKPREKPSDPRGEDVVLSSSGKVPLSAVEFAIQRICEHINYCQHGDLDIPPSYANGQRHCGNVPFKTWDHQWDQFLTWFYQVTHEGALLTRDSPLELSHKIPNVDAMGQEFSVKDLYERAKSCLEDVKPFWPQLELDGMNDLWILKPGAKSRGRGIQLINRLEMVNQRLTPAVIKETRYVIQKYIERPLLIHKTKFDIRQWFLVTSSYPLTVWMYKESYLRFSSQVFSLNKLHESIHLCNNAIQCRYTNGNDRDPALPEENMWDCFTFQTYLRTIGHPNVWNECIYPGMKESIIGALLASQDNMTDVSLATNITGPNPVRHKGDISFNQRLGTRMGTYFEIFGADFMLTEDFRPWLIEINSCPCMASSTSVTARMCPQVLEDVIKVVVDRREKKEADTGMFELVYKQHVEPPPHYTGVCLSVQGKHIQRSSKNEVAASGGLEPGDQCSPDTGERVAGRSPYSNEESDCEVSGGSTPRREDPECFVSDEEEEKLKGEEVEVTQENIEAEILAGQENSSEKVVSLENSSDLASIEALKDLTAVECNQSENQGVETVTEALDVNVSSPGKEEVDRKVVEEENVESSELSPKDDESSSESGSVSSTASTVFKTQSEILNSLKLFREWRKSVLRTQETCRGVLGQLESFKKWHMHYNEDFRNRSLGKEKSKPKKPKSSEKSRSRTKHKWKKTVYKNSFNLPKPNSDDKNSPSKFKPSDNEPRVQRLNSGKSKGDTNDQKSLKDEKKDLSASSTPRKDVKTVQRTPRILNAQPLNSGIKNPAEARRKYWEPLAAKVRAKNKSEDPLVGSNEISKSDAKIFERQRNFLDHLAALNRKKDCRNCFGSSSYDEMKKKAGFRPLELVTFEPPFL
ncbi:uncharacterized protein LOC124168144 isoform X2 [Ischnura elegans]|uniref:uncharacterized protein LOC124168144 isoform X2 n=1 Tax=Ischnura elegans TaxID=197161 RepID=UPI001ED8BBAC|nr:uncharacterized protein LOC124168144 isoform X2 [Ischnura elegans]